MSHPHRKMSPGYKSVWTESSYICSVSQGLSGTKRFVAGKIYKGEVVEEK